MSIPTTDRAPVPTTPPRPRVPRAVIAGATVINRRAGLEWLRSRYGSVFTIDIPVFGSTVVVADPLLAREVFRSPTDVLESVEQNLGRVLGPNSMFALTGDRHRRERKLLAPPFHGRRLRAYQDVITAEARSEMATWPTDREFATMPSMMRITLSVIIKAVFGASGPEFDRLRIVLPRMVELGSMLAVVPLPQLDALGDHSPWGRLRRWRREYDAIVGRLIDAAQHADDLDARDDVLSMMVASRYDDGSSMTRDEIADELLTMLSAGHETTATTLAWAVERIRRHPALLERLVAERDAGGSELLEATILEVQRARPVIDVTFRTVVADEAQLGDWTVRRGQSVMVGIGLIHSDASVWPDPDRFDPDRFVGGRPDLTDWVPFGGGTRRCIGAAFASMELLVVLQTLLDDLVLEPTTRAGERWRPRGVAYAPARGGRARVTRRRSA
ncbi:MAG: cytochrome P450 [Gordonia paraffinivorans]